MRFIITKISSYSDFALEKLWVTRCGWLRLCKTVSMGMHITNWWNFCCCGVKRYHYDKLIGIRELSECLSLYCFNNIFSTDNRILSKNIPTLDEVNEGYTVSIFRAIHFSGYISPYAVVRTISEITLDSASSVSYT